MKQLIFKKNFWLMLSGDILLLTASYLWAYNLRFEFRIPELQKEVMIQTLFPIVFLKICFFCFFKLYKGMWRYTGITDLINVIKSTSLSTTAIAAGFCIFDCFDSYHGPVLFIDAVLTVLTISGFRLGIRLVTEAKGNPLAILRRRMENGRKLLIIGAGDAGEKMIREILDNASLEYNVGGFLDDDSNKLGRLIHGVPVLGRVMDLKNTVEKEKVEEILIAIPSATGKQMKKIVDLCKETRIKYKTVPGIGELINGHVSVKSIRDVAYEDLLGREPVRLEKEKIGSYLRHRRVLVTGAGGSIGSELCRQIAYYNPDALILLDRTEKNLYDVEMNMSRNFRDVNYIPVLGDICHRDQMVKIFEEHSPDVVFHAAAYKHVPMMEMHPWEAIYNNILGSKNLIEISDQRQIERFVLVSTDKAVNPTNVMGATKRVTELLVQTHLKKTRTKFMAVRFGNVVGSSGSVIPLFKKQIEHGGPVTVTHPEVSRYFMTIPEAVQLILQAGSMGAGGEVFILDMGEPIKIADMARDLIRLSGLEPNKDIEIKFTGLRPGEKLYEELVVIGEEIAGTNHEKIMMLKNGHSYISKDELEWHVSDLVKLADEKDAGGLRAKLQEIVPEYSPSEFGLPAKPQPTAAKKLSVAPAVRKLRRAVVPDTEAA